MLLKFGRINRVKIPIDEQGYSKQIGFVTFESEEVAASLCEEASIRYDFYELPVEAAYFSAQMQQRRVEEKERAERRAERDRRDGQGGYRRDGEGGQRREGEGGYGRGGYDRGDR